MRCRQKCCDATWSNCSVWDNKSSLIVNPPQKKWNITSTTVTTHCRWGAYTRSHWHLPCGRLPVLLTGNGQSQLFAIPNLASRTGDTQSFLFSKTELWRKIFRGKTTTTSERALVLLVVNFCTLILAVVSWNWELLLLPLLKLKQDGNASTKPHMKIRQPVILRLKLL